MAKIMIDTDEWYPVFSIVRDDWDEGVEMEDTEVQEIKEVFKKFDLVQRRLADIHERIVG